MPAYYKFRNKRSFETKHREVEKERGIIVRNNLIYYILKVRKNSNS